MDEHGRAAMEPIVESHAMEIGPEMGVDIEAGLVGMDAADIGTAALPPWRAPMALPNEYVWFVFVSSLDIMLTYKILERDGTEVNPVARMVIDAWGLPGAIVFKYSIIVFFILACECIVRQGQMHTARRLSRIGVAVSAIPVVYSFGLLIAHTFWLSLQ